MLNYILNKETLNLNIYLSFKYIQCLCFVPAKDAVNGFKKIGEFSEAKFQPVLDYFETYYIGKLKENSTTTRLKPMFPIIMWNCYARVYNNLPRTNNSTESWHKLFAVDALTHPTIFKLIEQMRVEHNYMVLNYIQIKSGDPPQKRKKKYEERDQKIKSVVLVYKGLKNNEDFFSYMDNLRRNFN